MAESSALPIILLAEQFARLPGIGMKTAQRLAYHVTSMTDNEVNDLAEALMNVKKKVRLCSVCQNMTDREVCPVCSDTRRDRKIICVVEGPKDVTAIERTGEFNGLYHVLHGLISPIDGITPDKLRIKELIARIQSDPEINEIIMATNPTVEGDATAMYISRLLKPSGIRVTRLAFGLPVGGIIEYADEVTLFRALENRNEI